MLSKFRSNVSVPIETNLIEMIDKISYEKDYPSRAAYIRTAIVEKLTRDGDLKK